MSLKTIPRIAIIGGGITGLATAYYLQQLAYDCNQPIEWLLFESESRLGGKIRTTNENGFLMEEGADSFVAFVPWAVALCKELGLTSELIAPNPTPYPVWSFHNGNLNPYPKGFTLSAPPNILEIMTTPLLTLRGKFRLCLEPFIPVKEIHDDESLADFIKRRMGNEVLTRLIGPLLAGIHAADSHRLSMLATYPQMREMEKQYGSLYRAYRGKKSSGSPAFLTLKSGMSRLIDTLSAHLPREKIKMNCKIQSIEKAHKRYKVLGRNSQSGETIRIEVDSLVITAPSFEAGHIFTSLNQELADKLKLLRTVSTVDVYIGYDASSKVSTFLNGHGVLVSNDENLRITACSWTSNKYEGRASDNRILVRVFAGRDGKDEIVQESDACIVSEIKEELSHIIPVSEEPLLIKLQRHQQAFPQYDVGHVDRIAAIKNLCPPNVYLAGSAYEGSGVPQCIFQGKQAARKVLSYVSNN